MKYLLTILFTVFGGANALASTSVDCTFLVTLSGGEQLMEKISTVVSDPAKEIRIERSLPLGDEIYEVLFYAVPASHSVSMYVTGKAQTFRRYIIMNGAYSSGIDLFGGSDQGEGTVDLHCIVTEGV